MEISFERVSIVLGPHTRFRTCMLSADCHRCTCHTWDCVEGKGSQLHHLDECDVLRLLYLQSIKDNGRINLKHNCGEKKLVIYLFIYLSIYFLMSQIVKKNVLIYKRLSRHTFVNHLSTSWTSGPSPTNIFHSRLPSSFLSLFTFGSLRPFQPRTSSRTSLSFGTRRAWKRSVNARLTSISCEQSEIQG